MIDLKIVLCPSTVFETVVGLCSSVACQTQHYTDLPQFQIPDHSILLHCLEHCVGFGVQLFAGLILTLQIEHHVLHESSESKQCTLLNYTLVYRKGRAMVHCFLQSTCPSLPLGDVMQLWN